MSIRPLPLQHRDVLPEPLLTPFGMVVLTRRRYHQKAGPSVEPVVIDAHAVMLVEGQFNDAGEPVGTLVQLDGKTAVYATEPLSVVLAAIAKARRDILDV